MRFGLDIDGVLYDWEGTARFLLEEKFGKKFPESTYWAFLPDLVPDDQWQWLWVEGIREGLFRHGNLYRGALGFARTLAEKGDVVYVTSRPEAAVEDTFDWLSFHRFPSGQTYVLYNGQPKSSVRPFCDLYLDDNVNNCFDLSANTPGRVLLMDRPWNQRDRLMGSRVERIRSFDEVLRLMGEVA